MVEGSQHVLHPNHSSRLGRATVGDQLRRHAQHQPDKTVFVSYDGDGQRSSLTYERLDHESERLAEALRAAGVVVGDVVALVSHSRVECAVVYFAALKCGAAFTALNFGMTHGELSYLIRNASPRVVVAETEHAAAVHDILDELLYAGLRLLIGQVGSSPKTGWLPLEAFTDEHNPYARSCDSSVTELDLAMLVYTSGTEALPKAVAIPHRNYLIGTYPAWVTSLRNSDEDVRLVAAPLYTIAGIGALTNTVLSGGALVMLREMTASSALSVIERESINVLGQTPTFYYALAEIGAFDGIHALSLSRCYIYGGRIPMQLISDATLKRSDIEWATYWGQSELSQLGSVGWFRSVEDIPNGDPTWVGRALPQIEIRVVDSTGVDADEGEAICRGPTVMNGYYSSDTEGCAIAEQDWLHTGDILARDGDGNLFFRDRVKDVIKSGGLNVSSAEVERAIAEHPAVYRVAVVGLPDAYWSEAVTAFVVPREGEIELSEFSEMIRSYCRGRLAGYKVPKRVILVKDLPVDRQGKVQKRLLRQSIWEDAEAKE